jgi:DNA repair protein RadA/Sms
VAAQRARTLEAPALTVARVRTIHRCTECGAVSPKWVGRCPECEAWNSLVEELDTPVERGTDGVRAAGRAVAITDVAANEANPVPTGIDELDRVLGGGLVPGSVTLLGGEPGVGKSTLLLDVMARRAKAGHRVLYVSGEESMQQVRSRAERLDALNPNLLLMSDARVAAVLSAIDDCKPTLVAIDSIQTAEDSDIASAPGSVVQVRECAHRFTRVAKIGHVPFILVGHVTKEGGLAGPRVLEHVVDTVLAFEGERHHALRLLRSTKHRFGPTSELGLFEMTEAGLVGVPDPSGLFLADRRTDVVGSAIVPTMEGQRPLLVEVQALVAPSPLAMPRRSVQGLDSSRLAMLLAVLDKRTGLLLSKLDVYVSAVGGVRLSEPGCDLGLCLALASSLLEVPVPSGLLACGEVGLGGEVRQVSQTPRRLGEAARLGFRRAIVPSSAAEVNVAGIDIVHVETVADALRAAGLIP